VTSRIQQSRLERLEKRDPPPDSIVIRRVIVEADGSIVHPTRYRTHDEKHHWKRRPCEGAEDFERRVLNDAERIAADGPVALRPGLADGLARS
jgi:hypothetical protein